MKYMKDDYLKKGVCPHCGKNYTGRPALSRIDNTTMVCPDCGTREALNNMGLGSDEQQEIIDIIHRFTARQEPQTNYERLCSIKNNPYRQLNIREKSTGKTGVASLTKEGVYVFYGAEDGSDDKEITIEAFNTLFETEITKLDCPLW